ncbi:MAG: aminotransferase class I/II-fold pyridoxal phosphate-dependent enzyme [Erysipelotrichaceae bacterium]|nr:aminotransferase class I/II-fold pyridoxal phosphate-dependent enzyme [Erysipelotrichaceae bacterium]
MSIKEKLSVLSNNVQDSGIAAFFDLASSVTGVVSLAVGEPDFPTPWHICEEAVHSITHGKTFYTPNRGLLELRKEIASYLFRSYGVKYQPKDEILVTVGCSEAIDLTMRVFLNPGDEVILPSPGYVAYEPCILAVGGVCKTVEVKESDHFKLTPEKLKEAITPKTKMLVLNYPSNPTGGIMTREDYARIVPIIKESGIMVLADEIYGELTYGRKHVSLAEFEEIKDHVILMNGISKAYSMTGWRIGYICAHKDVVDAMYRIHQYAVLCAPTISQYASIEALKNGDHDIEIHRDSFEQRRNYIVNECNRIGLTCHMPEGAFYVFPSIRSTGLSSEEFCNRLVQEYKVAVVPGTAFGACGEGFIRISYAYSIDQIKEAVIRIEEFLKKLEGERNAH